MTIPQEVEGASISAMRQNRIIDTVNAHTDPNAAGMPWASGEAGHVVGQPGANVVEKKWGKLDEEISGGDTNNPVTVSIWELNSTESAWEDTEQDQEDVYPPLILKSGQTLAAGIAVKIEKFPDGRWYIVNSGCDAE